MKNIFLLLSLVCCVLPMAAQHSLAGLSENIVPNPGFERYASTPIGWFYKGQHFTNVMKYWSSPTGASPDVFGPKVRVPTHWAAKGFGDQNPHSGESMVGITVYGCEGGKPHCREYLQIQLSEPLVLGQTYYAEFWVSHLPRSIQTNKLGIYLSELPFDIKTDESLHFNPHIKAKEIITNPKGGWTKVSDTFQADVEAEYLILGNFTPDSLTSFRTGSANHLNFGYYYIDDVLLRKEEPILLVPVKEDDLTRISLEEGKIVTLKNIFFDHDKSELLPRSFVELRKLLTIMKANPTMVIEILGHTDNIGESDYNLYLSQRRAKAVVDFLQSNGISAERARYIGYGSQQPVASNTSEAGRQLNRRVEFLIVKR